MIRPSWELERRRGLGHAFRKATLTPWRSWLQISAWARSLPHFLIIGVQKGGTTSLFEYLIQHPHVVAPFKKEIRFFGQNYSKGLNWYRAHFPLTYKLDGGRKITGEASPYTIFHPLAPKRVAKHLPQVKLIALLRDPVERAYSHYKMNVRTGKETWSFEEAIENESKRLADTLANILKNENYPLNNHDTYSYLAKGIYVDQFMRWLKVFPREKLLILRSEDLFLKPEKVYSQTTAFLGLMPWKLKKYYPYNLEEHMDLMKEKTRKQLTVYFRPYNERLYELLDLNFGWN